MNILILGLGNIGLRHLQSSLKIKSNKLKIYLYDKKYIKFKSNQINRKVLKLYNIPKNFNFEIVIIATTSEVRHSLLKQIIINNKIKRYLIEKIAFISKEQYLSALKIKNIYINYPRPLMDSYINLKSYLEKKSIKSITIYGSKWNMLSNTLHFMNLFYFLTNEILTDIYLTKIHKRKYNSKRYGFSEIKGLIIFKNKKNQILKLVDSLIYKENIIEIFYNKKIIRINENLSKISFYDDQNNFLEQRKFPIEFQSNLTSKIILNFYQNKIFKYLSLKNNILNELLYLKLINKIKKINIKFKKIKFT